MKLATASILTVLLLCSCSNSYSPPKETAPPFKFKSLKLHQNNSAGLRLWDLYSPRASYRIDQRNAIITNPSGTLYRKGEATYQISAKKGVVTNDGELIELLDSVKLSTLDQRKINISAARALWRPAANTIELFGKPQASDPTKILTAGKARFNLLQELLELRDQPRLQQWIKKQNPLQLAQLDLRVKDANWQLLSGKLTAAGPIQTIQRPSSKQQRTLFAASLQGNTRENWLDFYPPVLISEPARKMQINAGLSRWWITEERITSSAQARATLDKLSVAGSNLELLEKNNLIKVGDNCELSQPGEFLSANNCIWNWRTGEISAFGAVELKRKQLNQITLAQELHGKTGNNGLIVFTAPGRKVHTQLRFPQAQAGEKRRAAEVQF